MRRSPQTQAKAIGHAAYAGDFQRRGLFQSDLAERAERIGRDHRRAGRCVVGRQSRTLLRRKARDREGQRERGGERKLGFAAHDITGIALDQAGVEGGQRPATRQADLFGAQQRLTERGLAAGAKIQRQMIEQRLVVAELRFQLLERGPGAVAGQRHVDGAHRRRGARAEPVDAEGAGQARRHQRIVGREPAQVAAGAGDAQPVERQLLHQRGDDGDPIVLSVETGFEIERQLAPAQHGIA